MAHVVQLKRSATTTAAPTAGQLSAGELAINTVDETIFFKNSSGTVKKLSAMSDLTSNMVLLTGAQTIAGVKTFSSNVVLTGTSLDTTAAGTFTIAAGSSTLNVGTNATTVQVGATGGNSTFNLGDMQLSRTLSKITDSLYVFLSAESSGIYASSGSTLGVGTSLGITLLGDWEGSGNGSSITVDDANQTLTSNVPITAPAYTLSSAGIQAKTASYTLLATDNGKIITMNVASANTLTVPASLLVGFNCTVIQLGAGQTTITASGTTLNSYQNYLKISGQHGSASIISYASNVYNVAGSLSA